MENTILLVDDEEDIRLVLGISLRDLGYEVFTAENGEEALEIFRREMPSIVVTDIKMPDIDGVELLRRIKRLAPETEVIMITGHGDMDVAIESFQQEASDFITKPIDVDTLENAVKRAGEKIVTRQKLREYTENLEGLVHEKSIRLAEIEQYLDDDDISGEFRGIQERFKQLYNEMPFYLRVQDRDYRITAINRQFARDFGDQVGDYCYKVLKQADEPCPDCQVAKVFESGEAGRGIQKYESSKGREYDVLSWMAPMRNTAGDITHAVVMSTHTAQVLEAQDHLAHLGLLIGSVSHSIKGMLTGLDGGLYLMESGLKKDDRPQVEEGLDVVKLMIGRIKHTVLDVLMFARERDLSKECFEVQDFCAGIADSIRPKIKDKPIELNLTCGTEGSICNADQGFLRTALVNVLENAVEACLADGSRPDHHIDFGYTEDQQDIVFEIRDDGPGLDEETRDKMFTLFFSRKGKKGTGLGLYITQKIVRQHGGHIEVDSEPGQGARFRIRIPKV